MSCVVSVEGLPVPARNAVLKSLQARLGLSAVAIDETGQTPLALLPRRLRALSRVPETSHTICNGRWLVAMPKDPLMRRLHRDLANALAERLLPRRGATRHIMICLRADIDEAFESAVGGDAAGCREVCLQSLRDEQEAFDLVAGGEDTLSPFDVQIVWLDCPRFAADNPVTLAKLVDLASQACSRLMDMA